MEAWYLNESPGEYEFGDLPVPEPGPTDVRIRVMASALNHMDSWLTKGRPRPRHFPHVPGTDVAGIIDLVGDEVPGWVAGDEVVVNPAVVPESALVEGLDSVLDPGMQILGEHRNGGHAEYVIVPHWQLARRPQGRTWAESASFPTCATNGWRMLRRGRMEKGSRVLVVGIGGGIATATMLTALHLEAEVWVTSREQWKLDRALELGAHGAYLSGEAGPGGFDLVIDSVGPATWDASIRSLRPGGRLCVCGGTSGPEVTLNLPRLFFKQLEIIGATIGSQTEFEYMTSLMAEGMPTLVEATYRFDQYPEALDRLRNGAQMGKLVLDRSGGV